MVSPSIHSLVCFFSQFELRTLNCFFASSLLDKCHRYYRRILRRKIGFEKLMLFIWWKKKCYVKFSGNCAGVQN